VSTTTESKSVSLNLPVQVRNLQTTSLFLSEHGSLEDLLMISSEVHLNWSQLCGHTTESKPVERTRSSKPADDAVFMPSWFTHGRFLESPFPMVLTKWLAELKSVPLGLRRFETYRWQLFHLSERTLTFTHGWFPLRFMQLVLAIWHSLMDSVLRQGLTHVVTTAELKSVSLVLGRFETWLWGGFFLFGHTLTLTHG